MSLRIQLILILTFFTTYGLTYTLEKPHQEELPGQSLESLFGPTLVICLLTFDVLVLFSCALSSKLTKNWIDVDYVCYNLNNLNENVQDTTQDTQDTQSARSSTSTNYVLDCEGEQSTVAIQLPIKNTTKSINQINQPPDEFNSIITIHNQTELSHIRSTRTIQVPTISHTNFQTSNNNSTGKMPTKKRTLINKPIRGSSLPANTTRMNPRMKPSQLPSLYSYI